MFTKSSRVTRVGAAATTLVLGLFTPLALSASPATAASTLCQKVSMAEVSTTLGIKVTKVTPVLNGSVTVCWYQVGSNPDAVYVRSSIGSGVGVFNLNKSQSKTQGEHPATDKHFAPYSAFSTWLGSASYGFTYGVVILKSKNELDVGATKASLAKVEALAKKVLPLL
jgi:hypothetical protein